MHNVSFFTKLNMEPKKIQHSITSCSYLKVQLKLKCHIKRAIWNI